ncbi:MAG: hypothetical protein IJ512_02325 [Ruminococcus sp.]|nr:hypothetical protein [Ruminococcus sp.]
MKTIYVLLTRSTTILSRIVHLITADTYTHVSISFETSLQPMYSSSRKNGKTLFPAGPCTEDFFSGYLKEHPDIPCALYRLQVSDEAYLAAKEEVCRIISNAERYHFNILGLIFCRLNISLRRKSHFFCSQFVSEILHRSRALKLPKEPVLMRPGDYMELPELHCLYRGTLGGLVLKYCAAAA